MAKKKKTEIPIEKQKKYSGAKLLSIPGINEAIDLVMEHAWVCAVNEAIETAGEGQFGKEVKRVINESPSSALDTILNEENIEAFIYDEYDNWLETIATAAGPQIAELWNLSESAGLRLEAAIYWGERTLTSEEFIFSPFVLLVNAVGEKDKDVLKQHQKEFKEKNCIIISAEKMQKGHIYLDVTELTYSKFRSSYKFIDLCREYLGIKKKDLQAGAPSNINTEKALEALYLKDTGQSPKNIVKKLGFKIYRDDNLGRSYPLLRKYLKIGKDFEERLYKLDTFIIAYIKSKYGIVA